MSFAHLHVHTTYSTFDGLAKIEDLFKRAEALSMPALAITDHGTMYGVPEFLHVARKHPSVKPIIGCEVYVTHHNHRIHPKQHGSSHLILLAKNLTGYRNLVRIVSEANTFGMNRKPCVSYNYIFKHSEGLIATSACIGGDIPKMILEGNDQGAALLALELKTIFKDDFYLEVSEHESHKEGYESDLLEKQKKVTLGIYGLSKQLGIKVVATNDVHFTSREDAFAHDVLLCANTHCTLDDEDRYVYTGEEYLKSEEEMLKVFPQHPDAVYTTNEVAEKIERYDITMKPSLPDYPRPRSFDTPMDYLCELARQGLSERGLSESQDAKIRLEMELETVRKYDFEMEGNCANYFLIMWDLLSAMRERGVEVGPGRGSSPGSLLNYVLHITDVNPLEYGLLFERFFCSAKALGTMPDIDIDLSLEGQEIAYHYLQDKYGYSHVSRIAVFARRSLGVAIKSAFEAGAMDCAGYSQVVDSLPKQIPLTMSLASLLSDSCDEGEEIRKWYSSATEGQRRALLAAEKMRETIPEIGVHACGILLSREPLNESVPLRLFQLPDSEAEIYLSQYDGRYVEEYGPVKFDILTLSTLNIIREVSKNEILSSTLDVEDAFELLRDGDTQGVFQFESKGMRQNLRRFEPDKFSDLVLLNALYRPGPMEWIPEIIKRKQDGSWNVSLSGTEEILAESYGKIVYQEQVMQIAKQVAGFTPEQADKLRKAAGKRKYDVLVELKKLFIKGGIERGYPADELEACWQEIEEDGGLMFMKVHAVCYSVLAYRCAELKADFPARFYASALRYTRWEKQDLKDDAASHAINVIHPDINQSGKQSSELDDNTVILGLTDIKGIGTETAASILRERKNGKFRDVDDFASRCWFLTGSDVIALSGSGALDCLGIERGKYFSGNPFWKDIMECMEENSYDRGTGEEEIAMSVLEAPEESERDEEYLASLQFNFLGLSLPL